MIELQDDENKFAPLTPVMPDENALDAPRAALAEAQQTLKTVEALIPLGKAGLPDPEAALREAKRLLAEKQAAVDAILDRMLNEPGTVQMPR